MKTEIGSRGKLFNLAEAKELLPLIRSMTQTHQTLLQPIQDRLNRMLSNDPRRGLHEREFEDIVSRWKTKIEKLGAHVNGLWVVEFDVGEGCLCWRYPDVGFNFFRVHGTSFADRQRLRHYIQESDPDWA